MRVAVTGATGFIGNLLVTELIKRNFSVRILSRKHGNFFPPIVDVVCGDLLDLDCSLSLFLADCDVVIHCAGETKNKLLMNDLHIGGTIRLLDELKLKTNTSSKRVRWVQLSSVGVYGPPEFPINKLRIITESSPALPKGVYEISKYKSDELVKIAASSGTFDYCILRPSNVIGGDMRSSYLLEFIHTIHRRLFFYIGRRGAMSTYVHVNDVVEALIQCAIRPEAANQIFNISSDCTLESFVNRISHLLGISPPKIRISEFLVRNIERFLSKFIRTPLTLSRVNSLVNRTHYPPDKITQTLSFKFSKNMPNLIDDVVYRYLEKYENM